MSDFTNMINKKLSSVILSSDKSSVTFEFYDGSKRSFGAEGDCCSSSWIEHLEAPDDLAGAQILEVVENEMDVTDDPKQNPLRTGCTYREHESLMVYSTQFKTDRGDIVLEFRNSSNGCYGGHLVDLK